MKRIYVVLEVLLCTPGASEGILRCSRQPPDVQFPPGVGVAPQKSVLSLEPRSVLFIDAQGVGTKSGAVNTVVIVACLTPLYAHPTRIHPRASSLSVHS